MTRSPRLENILGVSLMRAAYGGQVRVAIIPKIIAKTRRQSVQFLATDWLEDQAAAVDETRETRK
jgi:hypothetical protein